MGATWVSWRTTTTVIITILQIQALISVRTTAVTGVEGQRIDLRCDYSKDRQSDDKYFCYDNDNDDNMSSNTLIWTSKHDRWERNGRFSLYDNTTGGFFIVRVDKLMPEDSGSYRCGVRNISRPDHISLIELNVSRAKPPENLTHHKPGSPISTKDHSDDISHPELNLPFLTAVMCMAAMLFICVFTLCLLRAVKHRRPGPRQNRETSSDYETMMPSVRTEPEVRAPDCADLLALPPTPTDLCSHFTSKHRDSTVTLGLCENEDADVPKHICQYQHLDVSRLEEHVYHSVHGNSDPKDGPLGVKEQIKC